MTSTLKELIDIIGWNTGEYVNEENAVDQLRDLIAKKDSDLDDLKEDFQDIITGECEPDSETYEKYVRPNLFIAWAYLQQYVALSRAATDIVVDSKEMANQLNGDISILPEINAAADLLGVSVPEFWEKYSEDQIARYKCLKEVTDRLNSSSNDN